jgi:hypothetical protein
MAPPTSPSAVSEQHADPELEGIIPSQIDGDPVEVQSVQALAFALLLPEGSDARQRFDRFLSETGVDPASVTMAFATWRREGGPLGFQALRGPRSRPDRMLAAAVYFARVSQPDPSDVSIDATRLGGKDVTVIRPGDGSVPTWVYPRGEVIFLVSGDEATVVPILEALPF